MTEATLAADYALAVVHDADLKGSRVITTLAVSAGDLIAQISGHRVVRAPNRFTEQVAINRHIDGLRELTHLNHSCAPNVFLNTTELTMTALRDIPAGEELSFFYPSTEWQMAAPFKCLCSSPQCIGVVAGAKVLPDEELSRYDINAHIVALRHRALQATLVRGA